MNRCGSLKGWEAHRSANTRCCKWCEPYDPRLPDPKKQAAVVVPKKVKKVRPKPDRETKRQLAPRVPAKCGTHSGYVKHRRRGEDACGPCREAAAAYARERYVPRTKKIIPCGTEGGRSRHIRESEPVCEPCRLAYNKASRARHKAKEAANGKP